MISGNFGSGIYIYRGGQDLIVGDYLGTDWTGAFAVANGQNGVTVDDSASNTIGTPASGGNLISGNSQYGIEIFDETAKTTGNLVQGNLIGTNLAGNLAVANVLGGVYVHSGAKTTTIGGTASGAGNLISGNSHNGVNISDSGTTGNVLLGNTIGLNAAGTGALANVGNGVQITNSATGNVIGGSLAGMGNVISGNTGVGVNLTGVSVSGNVVEGNFVGTDHTGSVAFANGNSGILLTYATNNTIGGLTATPGTGAGNVASGNALAGIAFQYVGTTGNFVLGNLIGLKAGGSGPLPNGAAGVGIVDGAGGEIIGGTATGSRNVISGNVGPGVAIGPYGNTNGDSNNVVLGNDIGVGLDGSTPFGNAGPGVNIVGGTAPGAAGQSSGNIIGGTTSAARNVISGNTGTTGTGVSISGVNATGNVVEGDYIGTNASGTSAVPNAASGLQLTAGANANIIGGGQAGARNVISGNLGLAGIVITGAATSANVVLGNYIGADISGGVALGNGSVAGRIVYPNGHSIYGGVAIYGGSHNNLIGTDGDGLNDAAEGNLISGNTGDGVDLADVTTTANVVAGNRIGTNAAGTVALPNPSGAGVFLVSAAGNYIGVNPLFGTDYAAEGNLISGNPDSGIKILNAGATNNQFAGNTIGSNAAGTAAISNGNGVNLGAGAANNTVGANLANGIAAGFQRNLISGNSLDGVVISGATATGNIVSDNWIGLNGAGTGALANAGNGIKIANSASGNTIGGTASGVQDVVASSGQIDLVSSVAVTPSGQLIVTENSAGKVVRIDPRTGATTVIASGGNLVTPGGVALDASGQIYVADSGPFLGTGSLIKVDPTTGNQTVISAGGSFVDPGPLAIGPDGNIYVSDFDAFGGDGAIFRVDPATGIQTVLNQGDGSLVPSALAFDAQGHLLALYGPINAGPGEVDRVDLVTGARTPISSGGLLVNVSGLAIEPDGSLLVSNVSNAAGNGPGDIVRVDPATGAQSLAYGGGTLFAVENLALAPNGDLYATNYADDTFNHPQVVRIAANAAQNVISGNTGDGVLITGTGTIQNVVDGNFVGTDVSGRTVLTNVGTAVVVNAGASANTIGGDTAVAGNVIDSTGGSTASISATPARRSTSSRATSSGPTSPARSPWATPTRTGFI